MNWTKTTLTGIATAAAAMLLASGTPAFALTTAHTAAKTGATQGDCSGCHLPHKAQGAERLFPIDPAAATITDYGFIGAFCAEYCHNNASVPNALAADTALYQVGGGAAGSGGGTGILPGSHGLGHTIGNRPRNTVIPSTLPYGDDADGTDALGGVGIECTTCHNPHKNATVPSADASEALLQLDIDALCDECHTGRGAGDGAWAGYGDANALGSHPVGTNVTSDNDVPGNSGIFVGIGALPGATAFDSAYTGTNGSSEHNLGGHLINGGQTAAGTGVATNGITCVTCHAVHGIQADTGDAVPVAASGPFEDLLVIQQTAQGAAEPDFWANGDTDGQNNLCASCHSTDGTAANAWNPGGTAFSHPANSQPANADRGITGLASLTALAQTWPFGSNVVAGTMDVGIICESCHAPHPQEGGAGYGAVAGSHILRVDELGLCDECHTGTMADHHPANVPMGAMADAAIDTGVVGTLECADCHQGNGAHNWIDAGAVGLNPAWEPLENGRGTDTNANRFIANTSKECIDCHTAGGTRVSPTLHNNVAPLENRTEDGGSGQGSHYVGPAANTDTHGDLSTGTQGVFGSTTPFNAFTATWPGSGWSRFGGTGVGAYDMVCESCHELEPDKNHRPGGVGTSHALLLYAQQEAEDTEVSNLCTGCHSLTPGGVQVHPLTGNDISAAVDAGRTPVTLITAGATYADAASAPNNAEYPGTANRMTCDSCHQTHDAPTGSGTYILEYNSGVGGGLTDITIYGYTMTYRAEEAQGIDHQALCLQCHAY